MSACPLANARPVPGFFLVRSAMLAADDTFSVGPVTITIVGFVEVVL
jgi:hypothetical protein